ncbi:MAG: sulfatase-like hydrolase/transferase [Candidatus Latescibacteria bacterium]|nr:sulfatase-like hydrolase/transferase [Candidatus Latescibacterota bacterium]
MAERPNILFILPDQLRADFLSCYGADFIDTPHIDSLAERGVFYERAYTPSPLCVPARSLLLTGRNAIKNGVLTNNQFLRPDLGECGIHTWPELLGEAGYATAAIGKMHFYPWDIGMGFQHKVVAEDKRWLLIEDDYQRFLKERGYRKYHGDEHEGYHEGKGAVVSRLPYECSWDAFVGEETCKYIREYSDDKPFAAMVGFPGPHCPYDPSPEYAEMFDPDDMPDPVPEVPENAPSLRRGNVSGNRQPWNGVDYSEFTMAQKKKVRAHYAGLVKQIDDQVGNILQALRETGRLDNTVIVFSSDHGDHLGDHNLIGKGNFYESSIRVPLLVRLPGASGGEPCEGLVSIEDITATLLHLAGCQIPETMDSVPLPGLGASVQGRDRVFGVLSGGCMVYDGEWKLAKYASGEALLFNLREDPGEQRNRIGDPECQQVYLRLDSELTQYLLRSVNAANDEKQVAHIALYDDEDFGQPGWQRTYPQSIVPPDKEG